MYKKKTIALIFVLLALLMPLRIRSQTWQFVESPTTQNLARLDMLSERSGWAVSYDGLILSYNGTQWDITDSLQQIAQRTMLSQDSLAGVNPIQGDIYTIRMASAEWGWMAVNESTLRQYLLLQYQDRAWQTVPMPLQVKIRALDVHGSDFGVAVGEKGGYIYQDGQWHPINLPVTMDLRSVKIISPDAIFICGEKGTVLKGGKTWETIPLPTPVLLRDMDFLDENLGWIVGNSGTILRYDHGELIPEFAETASNLWAIDMLSPTHGFIVGQNGLILEYDGESWQSIPSPTQADLHDIEMIDEHTGFIVGAWGVILQYGEDERAAQAPRFILIDQVHLGSETLMDRIKDVMAVTVADWNGDDKQDLYLTCPNSLNHLLLNRGDGYFVDYVIESGTGGTIETRVGSRKFESGALAADFDRDEDIDLLLCGRRETTRYFVNDGHAHFSDLTARTGLPRDLNIIDGALIDFDQNGHPDVALADEDKGLRLFRNARYHRFQEINLAYLNLPATGIRAVKCADLNTDMRQDILLVYRHLPPVVLLQQPDQSWRRMDDLFPAATPANFVTSVTIADFNADTHADVFFCSEDGQDALYLFDPPHGIFSDRSQAWGILKGGRSYSAVAADWNLDGYMDLFISRYSDDYLYLNQNNVRFHQAAQERIYSKAGYLNGYTTGAAGLDIDDNGALDLIVGNLEFWSSLLQNRTPGRQTITLSLRGVRNTREALGAKIYVLPAGADPQKEPAVFTTEITLSNALFCQNSPQLNVPLDETAAVDIMVHFANGHKRLLKDVASGSRIEISDTPAAIAFFHLKARAFLQFLHIPQVPYELLKLLLYTALIVVGVRFVEKRYRWRPTRMAIYIIGFLLIYIFLSYLFGGTGWAYHTLPFAMLFFGFLVLISVNEPMRRQALHQQQIQKQIQESSSQLARTFLIDRAVKIIVQTLQIIPSFRQFVLYLYFPDGNYFLLKECVGLPREAIPYKFTIERSRITAFLSNTTPLDRISLAQLDIPAGLTDSRQLFPLVRKDQVLGLVLLGIDASQPETYEPETDAYSYLFLQLSIALDNLRIVRDMQEQQKLVAVGTFASSIIHNLKNPIEGIRLMVEMLGHDMTADDPRQEYLVELQNGIQRLREMLNHSFEFLKYNSQSQQAVPLNRLLEEVIKSWSGLHPEAVRFEPGQKELWVCGNAEQLRYAIENLLQNAMDAHQNHSAVEVACFPNAAAGGAVIRVRDWGAGIAAEDLDHIFDLFYSTRGRGRGLGLAITRQIVKNHGGHIDVHSDPQSGTEFRVILPIMQEERIDEPRTRS